jgi:hypothetical protein
MASINFATREINCKIVYYGPGLSGKTTNLQVIHQKLPNDKKSDMVSLATEQDRTLFFDFLPLDLGSIRGFKTKFQLYTVPGQVYYNSTRKLVLRGVDGVVFVADSRKSRLAENLESLQNLQQNLKEYGLKLEELPFILQYNKRDMDDVFSVSQLDQKLNYLNVERFEAISHLGKGVVPTLKATAKKVIEKFNKRQTQLMGKNQSVPKTSPKISVTKTKPKIDITETPVETAPIAQSLSVASIENTIPENIFEKSPTLVESNISPRDVNPMPSENSFEFQPPSDDDALFSPSNQDEDRELRPYTAKTLKSSVVEELPPDLDDDDDDDYMDEDDIELRPYIPKG